MGEALSSQLQVSSHAHKGSAPIRLTAIRVSFHGGLRNMYIKDDRKNVPSDEGTSQAICLQEVAWGRDSSPSREPKSLVASTNLLIFPGTTRVLNTTSIPRDTGDVEVTSIVLDLSNAEFDLDVIATEHENIQLAQSIKLLNITRVFGRKYCRSHPNFESSCRAHLQSTSSTSTSSCKFW